MKDYLELSNRAMLAIGLTYDNARAAEKMTLWEFIGDDNNAWKNGPYLTSPAGKKDIDHSYPYIMFMSEEQKMISRLVMGPNPPKSSNGGVRVPLPPLNKYESRVEPIIAKLAIIEQFEIYKQFLLTFNGPINEKRSKYWEGKVNQNILDLNLENIRRRNQLTHDLEYPLPTMGEAVKYFHSLREIAKVLSSV